MGELWYPNAIRHEGAHADYSAGVIQRLVSVVCHYTVGRNSLYEIGEYFTFLIDRDGTVHQGCPVNAVTWHAGDPWNRIGPGIEIEYLPGYDDPNNNGPDDDDIMTDAQVVAARGLVMWLHTEHGIPLAYYDGPRIASFEGFITHRSVIQTGAYHNDYWAAFDAERIFSDLPAPTPAQESQRYYDVFKMHSPTRAAVVTDSEVYAVGYEGTMDFVSVDEGTFDFIVQDVRAKRAETLAALHAQRDVRLV